MRLPRDLDSDELIKVLKSFGYCPTRQSGSHIRLTTLKKGEHHITIPYHNPLKIGTINAILSEIAQHFNIQKQELIERLFGQS